jgi:signal transduction histidine kinase
MKRASVLTLSILVIALSLGSPGAWAQPQGKVQALAGTIDLRGRDLSLSPVALDGQWQFFWQKLLTPSDSFPAPRYIEFPALWNNISQSGLPISPQGYATYRLTILLPRTRPKLALQVPDLYSSYALFVNGSEVANNGHPGKNEAEAVPFWTTRTVYLQTASDTLSLLLQVSNFWHSRGGPYKEILLGQQDALYISAFRSRAYDLVLTGCLFMGGLFFLGLYLFGRKDITILYFSLFCIVYSYRMIGTDLYVLHSLFPDLNWFITIRLEYLSLILGAALFARYTRFLFHEDINSVLMKMMVLFCLLYTGVVLITPPIVFTSLINVFLGIMLLCVAYAFYVNFKAARNRRSGSVFALLSTAVVLLIFLIINLNYFGIIPPMKGLVFAGYISFFFLQSLALSYRFAHSFQMAALQAAQGLKAKSEFLSTMSHEIRTPLNAVIGMTHLLRGNEPREDQKKDLDVLLFSANNLLSIVNNILDYNKIEEGKIHFEEIPMSLEGIARNIVAGFRMAADEKGIDIRVVVDERLKREVKGDPTRTSQVITNLLHNAIKFTSHGWVQLTIRAESVSRDAAHVVVSVEDTGIGIPREKHQLIFERFTQADSSTSRSYGGTGLGLAICKRILELQGVRLLLRSEPGKGSCFYFSQTFTFCGERGHGRLQPGNGSQGKNQLLKGVSILLVEDNPLNVLVAQTILENSGAEIDVATNGQEALIAFNARKHRLILMDLHMPVMDGYEATGRLRENGETLPIIALTANTPQEVEGEAYAAGLTDIVVKPFNPENLYTVILQYVQPAV